jgi:hypothetical protein
MVLQAGFWPWNIFLSHTWYFAIFTSIVVQISNPWCDLCYKHAVSLKPIESILYEGYLESNLWWAVNKQAMKKEIIIYQKKYMYILKLLLNTVTARSEALVSGNKFLYACVKEVCHLWAQPHFDSFHQLIITEALWS